MIVICGAGIVGLSIARELLNKGAEDIVILEKEDRLGVHASGRNSGVLHAGIYYTPDSLKARFCLKGNLLMREYCKEKGIPVLESGKVIVTRREEELETLYELYRRARANGTEVRLVDSKELREIEPYARTVEKALHSPLTAVVDAKRVVQTLAEELEGSGKVRILRGVKVTGLRGSRYLETTKGNLEFSLFVNCAGAHADRIAHLFGVGKKFTILPFKGTYKKLREEKSHLVRGNIYPVPDVRNPFLGVHFTKSYNGEVYIGPTAIPALGRENYGLLKGIDREIFSILFKDLVLFLSNPRFRRVALTEPRKYFPGYFFKDIEPMVEGLSREDIIPSSKVGIRPQLVDWERKELVMDFLVLKDSNSVHILNAVSPAFTSAFAFAEYVVSHYILEEVRHAL